MENGIDYGNDDDDETGATKPPRNTKASVENSGNQEAGNGPTQPPRTTEASPVGQPLDEHSGQLFSYHFPLFASHTHNGLHFLFSKNGELRKSSGRVVCKMS